MKEIFLNSSLNLINSKYNYNAEINDRLRYGLEIMYISITKLSVIFGVSIIFGLFKETFLFCLFVNGLRTFAYGIHAKKSWQCYISSLLAFVLMPYIFSMISIDIYQKIIISILCLISFIVFAPADTHKRPIVNKKQRLKLKLFSTLVCLIYIGIIFISKNTLINNMIILAMITECIVINPITYKIFDLPYDNYKEYLKSGV